MSENKWRTIAKTSAPGGHIMVEVNEADGVYRATLDEPVVDYATNQNEAKQRLAEKLMRIAAGITR